MNVCRYDPSSIGDSEGRLETVEFANWVENAATVLESLGSTDNVVVGSSIKSMPLKHRYYSDSLNRHMQLRFETNNGHLVSVHWRQPLFRSFLCTLTIAMALSVC